MTRRFYVGFNRRGAFFSSRAQTARGLYRAALAACRKNGLPENWASCELYETRRDGMFTIAAFWDPVVFDFDDNYWY